MNKFGVDLISDDDAKHVLDGITLGNQYDVDVMAFRSFAPYGSADHDAFAHGFKVTDNILCALGGLALSAALWQAQPIITFVGGDPASAFADLQRVTDMTFQIIIVVAVAINVTKLFVDGWRLVRGR